MTETNALPTASRLCAEKPITQGVCNRRSVAFGGFVFGAAIDACETLSDQQLQSASIQYLRPALLGEVLSFKSDSPEILSSSSFVSLDVEAGSRTIAKVQARLADKGGRIRSRCSGSPQNVPPPEFCREIGGGDTERQSTIWGHVDIRDAGIASELGRIRHWIRGNDLELGATARIALLSDWAPTAYGGLTQSGGKGVSVNAVLTVFAEPNSEWVLAEYKLLKQASSCVHMSMALWGSSGEFLGDGFHSFVPIPDD